MGRLPYREGDFFVVPLRDRSGYGVGRIARAAPGGRVLLGYFFRRRYLEKPTLAAVTDLFPKEAVMVRRFGDLRLVQGEWPVLGGADTWRREDWPMPAFARRPPDGRAWRVEYPDNNPNGVPREVEMPPEQLGRYPDDALLGAGIVEVVLTETLSREAVN